LYALKLVNMEIPRSDCVQLIHALCGSLSAKGVKRRIIAVLAYRTVRGRRMML